jgi:hypothetical protein
MGLYYPTEAELITTGYADAGYLLDPANAKFQIGYVYLTGPIAIS